MYDWEIEEDKRKKAEKEAKRLAALPICACGKPIGPESPQIDQCLSCFNRN